MAKMIGHEESCRVQSTGRLCSGVEAKIVNIATGELLPTNEQGELCIRSLSTMLGISLVA